MPTLSPAELKALREQRAIASLHTKASSDPAYDGVFIAPVSSPPDPRLCCAPPPQPVPAAPPPAPPPGPNPTLTYCWPGNPKSFNFATPLVLLKTYYPHLSPHAWQQDELYRIGGDLNLEGLPREEWQEPTQQNPYIYNLVAANGSGKDTYIITPCAVWFLMRFIRSRVVITSESHKQLKEQTFKPIVALCEAINAIHGEEVFEIRELAIKCMYTGSEIIGFCTDEPGKVEGYHPFPENPNSKMMVIIGEAKSIKDPLFEAFSRFTGFSHWLQVSSPGARAGQFYKSVELSDTILCKLGIGFTRHVTAFECPNISPAHIEQVRLKHGEHSAPYKTGILAQFFESADEVVIPGERLIYTFPAANSYNLPVCGGLDVGLGVDLSEFWVIHGNQPIYHAETTTSSPNVLHNWIIQQFKLVKSRFGCDPENISGDMGGLGAPILKRVMEAGYGLRGVNNQAAAYDDAVYANIGAEMYFRVARMFELGRLIQPKNFPCYERWKKQLTTRKYFTNEKQKLQLEEKKKAKGRLGFSPDCADAYVLAYSLYDLAAILADAPVDNSTPKDRVAQFVQSYNERAFDGVNDTAFDVFAPPRIMTCGQFNIRYK